LNFGGGPTSQKYKVVGNLPFYLTAPVIRMFLEMKEVRPLSLTLVVQKEVAQRICAQPPKMSILANSVQFYADAEIVSYISKNSFWPQPKVDAAIIKIIPNPQLAGSFLANDEDLFFKIMKAGFSQPRKQLANNLSKGLKIDKIETGEWLTKNNIKPEQRAETLNLSDWINLTENFNNLKDV
ncbi:MAG: rRNA adenine dimethyltransferase family protein, partial [Patescibacteria group bacterium]